MKNIKILSTAGLGISDSNRLKTYCSLMQENLVDQWHIVDEFVAGHVCFIDFDFLINLGHNFKPKSQVTVLVTKKVTKDSQVHNDFKFQIKLPFTTSNVKQILNKLSETHNFVSIETYGNLDSGESSNLKTTILNFGKSIFGGKNKIDLNKANRKKYNKIITEKLTVEAPEIHQLLFMGSAGSGKSKAIETVCDGGSLNTDLYLVNEETAINVDYGEVVLNHKKIKLVGMPSKIKNDKEWQVLTKQADIIVIMLDLSRPEPLTYLEFYDHFIQLKNTECDVFCCLTHCDQYKDSMHHLVLDIKQKYKSLNGIYHMDARKKENIIKLLGHIYKF